AELGVTGAALPYKGNVDKGKTVKAHVSAPGHVAKDVDVAAGKTVDVALKPMPHVVHVTSKPGGAAIFVDGQPTRRTTPGDVDLTAAQAEKGAKIELRKSGFERYVGKVQPGAFSQESERLVAALDANLTAAKVQVTPPGGGGGGSGASGGSATTGG